MPQPWPELSDPEPLARTMGSTTEALLAEARAFPTGVWGVALTRQNRVVAGGIVVERELESAGRLGVVRVVDTQGLTSGPQDAEEPSGAEQLVGWAEERARALGATRLRVSIQCAPGLTPFLLRKGYSLVECFCLMERAGPSRPLPDLPADIEERSVASVGVPAFLETSNRCFEGVPGAFALTSDDWEQITIEPGYRDSLVRLLLLEGRPVGFLRGILQEDTRGEVEAIGVLPSARRQGLGTYALRRCEALLTAAGAKSIELTVAASNSGAYSLYEREGYVVRERRETWDRAIVEAAP